MRIAALDVGEARIGIAVSDELGLTAQGVGVVQRKGGRRDLEALAERLAPYQPERLLVRLPPHMNRTEGAPGGRGGPLAHPRGGAPDPAARVLRRAAHHRGGGAYPARGRSQPAAAPGADRPGGGHPHPPDLPGSPRVTGSRLLSGLVVAFVLVTSGAAALVVH